VNPRYDVRGTPQVRGSSQYIVFVCLAIALAAACNQPVQVPTTPTPLQSTSASTPPTGGPPDATPAPPLPGVPPFNPTGQTVSVLAVGDIGWCGSPAIPLTARLIERNEGQLLLSGDLAYMQGSLTDFQRCFEPYYGQFRHRWRPVPGNHEYDTPNAAGYFQFFGSAAGSFGRSYYSFRAGDWLVLMLDSNVPTNAGSMQYEFVRAELQTNRNPCAMAVWHHPLFTSGPNGPSVGVRELWALLQTHQADVVVNGHEHLYERFARQDAEGRADARGLQQFIAGTGGARLYDFHRSAGNSLARLSAHGVLKLTLSPTSYSWTFLETSGATGDAGAEYCH
jgi:acid phosphatase type 7